MVQAVGGEEQRHHPLVDHSQLAVRLLRGGAPGEDLPDEQPHRSFAGLMGHVHGTAPAAQPLGEELRLGGGPGPVEALEHDEAAGLGAHGLASGGGSIPSSERTSRSLRSAALSWRRRPRARRYQRTESPKSHRSSSASG